MLIKLKTNYRVKTTNGIKEYKSGDKIEIKQEEADILIKIGHAEKTEMEKEVINKILIPKINLEGNESSEVNENQENKGDLGNGGNLNDIGSE